MPDAVFEAAVAATLAHEGGYTDDPDDAGNWTGGKVGIGELRGTKYGISAASYPSEDIVNLTPDRAKLLYFTDFWCRYRLGQLPGVSLPAKVFDTAVNMGGKTAIILLQRALAACGQPVAVDGQIGPKTVKACRSASDALLPAYRKAILDRYDDLIAADPALAKYRNGWTARALA